MTHIISVIHFVSKQNHKKEVLRLVWKCETLCGSRSPALCSLHAAVGAGLRAPPTVDKPLGVFQTDTKLPFNFGVVEIPHEATCLVVIPLKHSDVSSHILFNALVLSLYMHTITCLVL